MSTGHGSSIGHISSLLEVVDDVFQSFEFRDEGTMEIHECGNHLLFTTAYDDVWCRMLYDLDKREWTRHYIIDKNCDLDDLVQHGLFFQPQLNGPPSMLKSCNRLDTVFARVTFI